MDGVSFFLELLDKITGPSRSVTSSLRGVQGAMKSLDGALDNVGKKGLAGWSQVVTGALRQVGASVVQTTLGLASRLASGTMDLGKYALSAASFKRNALAAFGLIEGTPEKAAETYEKIKKIADIAPFETEQVVDTFKTLRASGFGQAAAEQIFLALSDIASTQGAEGGESLKGLTEGILKVKAVGKLDMETLRMISERGASAGVNIETILGTIAKQKGKTIAEVQAMLSSGKIDSATAIAAIMATVQEKTDKGGALGTATKLFGASSLEGAISTFKSALRSLFEDLNLSPIIGAFTALNAVLTGNTPEVTALKKELNDAAVEVGALIKSVLTTGNIRLVLSTVLGFAIGLIDAIRAVGGVMSDLGAIFSDVFSPWVPALAIAVAGFGGAEGAMEAIVVVVGWVANLAGFLIVIVLWVAKALWQTTGAILAAAKAFGLLESIDIIGQALWKMGLALGFGAENGGWLVQILVGLGYALGAVLGMFAVVVAGIMWFQGALAEVGAALAYGLWEGFRDGIVWMIEQIPGLMEQLPDSVRDVLGVHSPSTVMFDIGKNTSLGFLNGQASVPISNDNYTNGLDAIDTSSGNAGASQSSGDVTVNLVQTYNIHGGDPGDMQRAAEDGSRNGVAAALDGHALSQGTVAA